MTDAYDGLCNIIDTYRRKDDVVPINALKVLKRDYDLASKKTSELPDYKKMWETMKNSLKLFRGTVSPECLIDIMVHIEKEVFV